jgi:hypothetical protein
MAGISNLPIRSSAGVAPQRFVRYWWVAFGYDVLFVDLFFESKDELTKKRVSEVIDIALRRAAWLGINLESTFPSDLGPLYRDGQGELWDWEAGLQDPPIPHRPGTTLIRAYRIREVAGKYPHLSPVKELWINQKEVL